MSQVCHCPRKASPWLNSAAAAQLIPAVCGPVRNSLVGFARTSIGLKPGVNEKTDLSCGQILLLR
jgi:hypothetical protein